MADKSAILPVMFMQFDGMEDDDTISPLGIAVPVLRALEVKKMTFPFPDRAKGTPTTEGGCLMVRPQKNPDHGFLLYIQDERILTRLITELTELKSQLFGPMSNTQQN